MEIAHYALKAMDTLESAGYEAYAVGGCIRDLLMGLKPDDYDITTSALPNETLEVFSSRGFKTIATGLKHGTVTVIIDGLPIEITTFRTDGAYSDGRHPERVRFVPGLEQDLSRRDFTVNAMAYNEKRGLIDLFGGASDVKKKQIKAVGDPIKRFEEDALRILRAFRFASQKGFGIEKNTETAALASLPLLEKLSAERVFSELKKLIMGQDARKVMLSYPHMVCAIIPELKQSVGFDQRNPHHVFDVYTHTVTALAECPPNETIRLAALLHDSGKPQTFEMRNGVGHFYGHSEKSVEIARAVLDRLKSDNHTKETVCALIKYHDPVIEESEKAVKRYIRRLGKQTFLMLLDLKGADNLAQAPQCASRLESYAKIRQILEKIEKNDECFSLRQLALNGDDLIRLGVPQGKRVGRILSALLEEVISSETENTKQALTEAVKSRYLDADL